MSDEGTGLVNRTSVTPARSTATPVRTTARATTTPTSTFASQLDRATVARATQPYKSPLAQQATQIAQANADAARRTSPPPAQAPTQSLAARSSASATTRTQTTSTLGQRAATTTTKSSSKSSSSTLSSLTQPPTSLTTTPRAIDPATNLVTSIDQVPSAPAQSSLDALTSPHPSDWPTLEPVPSGSAMALADYPKPVQDNGRGMHWIPTTKQSPATVDKFVAEAQKMGVKWMTFLNDGANVGDNDYLVGKLKAAGIEPVMRIYSPKLEPLQGDVEGMVRHYTALGVHYFQPFNEPNLNVENPDGKVSVDRYLDVWVPAAKAIERGGGLAGFGALAPGGDYDDQQFLNASLQGLKDRGELGTLDKSWISMHNYTWNHPINDRGDGDGFFKFRAYASTVRSALGRDLPIVGTEGGTFEGQQEDPKMPAVTSQMAADWTSQSFKYMRDQREPWLFASSVWTIANAAGGANDGRFEAQALFKASGGQSSIVGALRNLA